MRRGLLKWDREEVPDSVLDARVSRLRAGMRDAGLDAVLVYTSFPRPAAVSYLVHFVPYWSQGLLAVPGEGPPVLLVSLSKRVGDWIRTTAHVADLVHTPDLGRAAAALVTDWAGARARVGVVELDHLPGGISRTLVANGGDMAIDDASALFRAARGPADEVEVALATHAATLAQRAMQAGLGLDASDCGPVIAAIERTARLAGAEEVQVLMAPDLSQGTTLERIEGRRALGPRFALRVSLAHKGHWIRLGRGVARDGPEPAGWRAARERFGAGLAALGDGADGNWRLEGCVGTLPLQALPDGGIEGAIVTVSAEIETADGPMFACEPVLLASEAGGAARSLLSA